MGAIRAAMNEPLTHLFLLLSPRGYSGTGMKCPNAAHLWQLGWAKPVADLDLSALTVGRWWTFILPTASDNLKNFLRLTGLAGGTYFINYRLAKGQYEQVREGQYEQVHGGSTSRCMGGSTSRCMMRRGRQGRADRAYSFGMWGGPCGERTALTCGAEGEREVSVSLGIRDSPVNA